MPALDLLVVPGPLVSEKTRVRADVEDLGGLLAALGSECGVADRGPLAISLVVAGSERAAPVTGIDELGAKAKVSLRLASDFVTTQHVVGSRVELCGLSGSLAEARLNGTQGKVVLWDSAVGLYVIELELQGGKEVRYPAANVRAVRDDQESDEDDGDAFEITVDMGGDTGEVEEVLKTFEVKKNETMGSVKRRMSVSMGVSPEEMAVLLGMGNGEDEDAKTVKEAGVLSKRTKVRLPQCSGSCKVQYRGKGKFENVQLGLRDGRLTFVCGGLEKRTAKVFGCEVSPPKSSRRGHPFCFRLDLGGPRVDNAGDNKYVISVATRAELNEWTQALVAYSSLNELTAARDDDEYVEEPEAAAAPDDDDEEADEEEGGDSFEISLDVGVKQQSFTVKKNETMGSVKRRMSVSMGVSPEEMAILMGMGAGKSDEDLSFEDSMTVEEAGILKKGAKIRLPHYASNVNVQYMGKGKFEAVHLDLRDGKLQLLDLKSGDDLRDAKVFGCKVSRPKGSRKGHPYCLRLDMGGPQVDSRGDNKYIISVSSPAELRQLGNDLHAYSTMNEIAALGNDRSGGVGKQDTQQAPQAQISEGVPPQRASAALRAAPATHSTQSTPVIPAALAPASAAPISEPTEAQQLEALRAETDRLRQELDHEERKLQTDSVLATEAVESPKQEVVLLILANELVQSKTKLSLYVDDFSELLTSVQRELGIDSPIVLHRPVKMLGGEPVQLPEALKDLKELDEKTKVNVVLRTAYLQLFTAKKTAPAPTPAPAPALAAAATPGLPNAPASTSTTPAAGGMELVQAEPEVEPPVQSWMLLIFESALYPRKAKITVSASDILELRSEVQRELGVSVEIVICKQVADGEKPEALTSLDQLEAKTKVQLYTPYMLAEARGESPVVELPSPTTESPSPRVPMPDYVGLMAERGDIITYSRRMRIDRVEDAVFDAQEAMESSGEDVPDSSEEEQDTETDQQEDEQPATQDSLEPEPVPAAAPAPPPTAEPDSEEEFSDEDATGPAAASAAAEPAAEPVAEPAPEPVAEPAAEPAAKAAADVVKPKVKVKVKASGVRTKPAEPTDGGAGVETKPKPKVKVTVKPKVQTVATPDQ